LIDGVWRRSVTNVGKRPTFGNNLEASIETHVLDWTGDLYGDVVRVRFLYRLRDEMRFGSVDELKHQIDRDVLRARQYFDRPIVRRSLAIR
jgi:riboflavin kinase / FMN adenylyltransferase